MSAADIIARIEQQDPTLDPQALKLTPDVARAIADLMQHNDHDVRATALDILDNHPGPFARQAVIAGLGDDNVNVRSIAGRMAETHCEPADRPVLHQQLSSSDDGFVREHIALAIGRIGDPVDIAPLQRQYQREPDSDARHALHLALTQLQDPEARTAYIGQLEEDDPRARARAVQDFEYLRDPALLRFMLPLLDDARPALNVGKSDKKRHLRVSDLVIRTLDSVLGQPFGFPVLPRKQYSPEEIDQAKAVVRARMQPGP